MADVELNLVSDTREAQAQYGTEMPDAIEKMSAALDDVARDGDKATESLESGFRDVLDGAGEASEAIEDVADEGQNASLSVRSIGSTAKNVFEGDFAGAANSAIGLLRGFGPAGVIAGGALAAGIGFATAGLAEAQAAADELREKITSMYREAAEAGRTYLDQAQVDAAVLDIIFDTEKRTNAQKEAARIGVDASTYIRAQAGDQSALNAVIAQATALYQEQLDILNDSSDPMAVRAAAVSGEKEALGSILRENEAIRDATLENIAAAELYQDVLADGATQAAAVADRIDRIPTEVTTNVKVTADTTALERDLARSRTVRVVLEGVTRNGQRVV